jgi:hypothetical protein
MRNFKKTYLKINTRMQVENNLDQIFEDNGDSCSEYDYKILGIFFQKFVIALETKNNVLFTSKVFIIIFFYYYLIK